MFGNLLLNICFIYSESSFVHSPKTHEIAVRESVLIQGLLVCQSHGLPLSLKWGMQWSLMYYLCCFVALPLLCYDVVDEDEYNCLHVPLTAVSVLIFNSLVINWKDCSNITSSAQVWYDSAKIRNNLCLCWKSICEAFESCTTSTHKWWNTKHTSGTLQLYIKHCSLINMFTQLTSSENKHSSVYFLFLESMSRAYFAVREMCIMCDTMWILLSVGELNKLATTPLFKESYVMLDFTLITLHYSISINWNIVEKLSSISRRHHKDKICYV